MGTSFASWFSIREDQGGEDYVEAVLRGRPSPDGNSTDDLSNLTLDYRLLPEYGRYSMAIFRVVFAPRDSQAEVETDVGDVSSVVGAYGEFVDSSNSCILYNINGEKKIGSIDIDRSKIKEPYLTEKSSCYMIIEIEYHDEFTKTEKGYSEERNEKARREKQERIQRWVEEYY